MIREEIVTEIQNLKTAERDLKKFGVTMASILGIITLIGFHKMSWWFPYLFLVALGFWLIGITQPKWLKQIYIGWMALAITMGYFMTRIILSFLFYVVFTVIGLISRILNPDLLDQQYQADATTYWKKHKKPKDAKQHFEQQF